VAEAILSISSQSPIFTPHDCEQTLLACCPRTALQRDDRKRTRRHRGSSAVTTSAVGHERRFRGVHDESASPSMRDIRKCSPQDRIVPKPDSCSADTHSITSSARASSVGGTSRPSAFAILRLITSSNLVGCSTGISAGFAPRRILSTRSAARRKGRSAVSDAARAPRERPRGCRAAEEYDKVAPSHMLPPH